ncbi:MAG TPA: PDZ domain-containing protein [Pirellulales bacterium]|nr:PDZ domain-containing protein [Pirellulales bacterium]
MRSRMEPWFGRVGSLALAAVVLLSGTSAFAQQLRDELRRAIVLVENEGQPSEPYWIGVACGELTDALKAQLELTEGQGVLVDEVVPDSPAAQAGLKKYDVLVSAGDKALTNPQDLVDAAAQAKGTELSLQFIRAGKKLTLTVMPAMRPAQPRAGAEVEMPVDVDAGALRELIQQYMRRHGGGSWRMRMLQPGMVLPPGAPPGAHFDTILPENLSISISRQGKQPAKVSVKQDDKSWELTEDKLQELPDDIRPHVERMLGRMPMMAMMVPPHAPVRVEADPNTANPFGLPRFAPGQPRFPGPYPDVAGVERRLDELNQQIHELREAIEKLQKQSDGGRK